VKKCVLENENPENLNDFRLAGRIAYIELFPLSLFETDKSDLEQLWLEGRLSR